MLMTHYMELLSLHSPWFLILFMVVPVVIIETIFVAEAFSLLANGKETGKWRTLSHRGGLFFSLYFIVAALYLVTRYIPTIEWRGPIDMIAVWSYVLGIIPAFLLLFTELGFIGNGPDAKKNAKSHIFILLLFVFFTHAAMVFGMVDPRLGGYEVSAPMHQDMQMDSGFPHGAMMNGARQGGPQQAPLNGSYGCGQTP
ncbi:DUF6803 family protein [uncultured Acidaminococcus sp.]|uniref:DUF6803 family protein n=1 Tax=uncultured Acidaminococcus sp. TaxID=352152 RepID=UPI002675D4F7|nr:DUF6803 family protein [uncultured Acidaminococcus sp.]